MAKRAFGELEHAILNILKKSGNRMTVKEVFRIIGQENKYTTIMTVMHRMTEKGLLAREMVDGHYEYWLLLLKAPSFLEQLKKKAFGFKTAEMVSYLIESAEDVTEEELDAMEKILQKAKNKNLSK